jgi:hypothetical protein
MNKFVEHKDGLIFIKDGKAREELTKILERTRKYCMRSKKEIETLLDGELDIRILMNMNVKTNQMEG